MLDSAPRTQQEVLCLRDLRFVGSISEEAYCAEIVIGITVRNQANHLPSALASALAQSVVEEGRAVVLVLDDQSTDDWRERSREHLSNPRLIVATGACGTAARARNALLDLVDDHFPRARWVARLDADDCLASAESVAALCRAGEEAEARFVVGSNFLVVGGRRLGYANIADPKVLQNPRRLLALIESFCFGDSEQELPSCNLVLRCRSGVRYPDVRSAEDHWLVAQLLFFSSEAGVVVPSPVYSTYSLGGAETHYNRRSAQWAIQRERLARAAKTWVRVLESGVPILGVGQEGIVWRESGEIVKEFYPWALDACTRQKIEALCETACEAPIPVVVWCEADQGQIRCHYPAMKTYDVGLSLSEGAIRRFLRRLHHSRLVTSNIKRANLRVTADGEILYIDVGKDIVPFSPSRFLDAAARLYGIGVLKLSDGELVRRTSFLRPHEALGRLEGFASFYLRLIEDLFPHCRLDGVENPPSPRRCESRVTLLIKACAQDAEILDDQVRHIVSQLSFPASFYSVVLTIDPYSGPYLRQFARGDRSRVKEIATNLVADGVVDEVWWAPEDTATICQTYEHWFGRADVTASHTTIGAPLFSQLWAFDRVATRYLLQCDVDVLVGREDLEHDFLDDMLEAAEPVDVLCVGFNIPQSSPGFVPYHAAKGLFVPEVRFGLLDLERIHSQCPMPNSVRDGKFELMWHRSLQLSQSGTGARSVRGGDSRTFYVHPRNQDKGKLNFAVVRDLVAQGRVPAEQRGEWDVNPEATWRYPTRSEPLIFLMKGRQTQYGKLKRCIDSLILQNDQRFGLILMDDCSCFEQSWFIPMLLGPLRSRTTLVRRRSRVGYIPNLIEAAEEICTNDDALIVTLDLDDALMSPEVSLRLLDAADSGADVIHGSMFRPEKPLQMYEPDYADPRSTGGGNTWAHLRGFKSSLFRRIPKEYLRFEDSWIDDVTDYAVMIPAAELSAHPVFIDDIFCYYHQRTAYSPERKARQRELLTSIFSRKPLAAPKGTADRA